jgi:hypothetical protein
MSAAEPTAEGICVAVAVALGTAGGGGVPGVLARGDDVSAATAMSAGAVAMLLAEGVAAERGPSVGVGSAMMSRGVGVTLASGVALASAGTVGNDCGVITAWASSGVASVAARREPTATAATIVASSTMAAKSARVDLRQALSAASSFAVHAERSDARRIDVSPAITARQCFAHPVTAGHGHRPPDAGNEQMRLPVAR